jgi:hypothetical protein
MQANFQAVLALVTENLHEFDSSKPKTSVSPNPIPKSATVMGNGDNMQGFGGDSVHN